VSLLGWCRFRSGKYSTKFIAEEFPDPHGFTGVELSHSETMNLVAAAAAIHQVGGDHMCGV